MTETLLPGSLTVLDVDLQLSVPCEMQRPEGVDCENEAEWSLLWAHDGCRKVVVLCERCRAELLGLLYNHPIRLRLKCKQHHRKVQLERVTHL